MKSKRKLVEEELKDIIKRELTMQIHARCLMSVGGENIRHLMEISGEIAKRILEHSNEIEA